MANITHCMNCGACYEAGSEEQANEPDRRCATCVDWLRPGHPREWKAEPAFSSWRIYAPDHSRGSRPGDMDLIAEGLSGENAKLICDAVNAWGK